MNFKSQIKKIFLKNRLTRQVYQRYLLKKRLASEKFLKIHLGCGQDYLPGYINIDSNPKVEADLTADDLDLFPDNCADAIESYHFFEHLELQQAKTALKEWLRILKPGGLVIIELPNLAVCVQEIGKHFDKKGFDLAMAGIFSYPPFVEREGYPMIHKWGWSPETLGAELSSAGFVEVHQYPIRQTWRVANAFGRDMQIRATKPRTF